MLKFYCTYVRQMGRKQCGDCFIICQHHEEPDGSKGNGGEVGDTVQMLWFKFKVLDI